MILLSLGIAAVCLITAAACTVLSGDPETDERTSRRYDRLAFLSAMAALIFAAAALASTF